MKLKPGTLVVCVDSPGKWSAIQNGRRYIIVSQKQSTGSVTVKHASNGRLINGLFFWTRFKPVEKSIPRRIERDFDMTDALGAMRDRLDFNLDAWSPPPGIITHICCSRDGRESAVVRMGEAAPLIEGWLYIMHPSDEMFRDWRGAMRRKLNGDTR